MSNLTNQKLFVKALQSLKLLRWKRQRKTAFGLIQGFDGNYADVQQIVVRSFIGKNAFVQAEEIEKRFTEEYNKRVGDVGSRQAEVDEYIKALTGAIEYFNNNLDECFKNIHNFIAPAYVTLKEQIKTCEEFDNTPNPFASFLTVTTTPAIGTTPAI
ncbi:CLUMA_CG016955, isoform A [Clunio marinus]|uniref:CLUMA_CG016955, isoform A n=1 Tax=Clunio marinus TaxID=568069 RepID=A0A1J1IVH1_9DIPT|nr:CLUMA_CG016955, isoform A [Clunio marinus]